MQQRVCEVRDDKFIVSKSAHEGKTEQKVYQTLFKNANYKSAKVENKLGTNEWLVTTKRGERVKLISIPVILEVIEALQELHTLHVTHGDIKPAHILRDPASGKIFFIDFGYSCVNSRNFSVAQGFTTKWTSFDCILSCKMHELDDYEAVFTSALFELAQGLPTEPNATLKSMKRWAKWKLQLMDHVYTLFKNQSPLSKELKFVVKSLMRVWAWPRKAERLTRLEMSDFTNPKWNFDFAAHVAEVRAKFLKHLGRKADGHRSLIPLNTDRKLVTVVKGKVKKPNATTAPRTKETYVKVDDGTEHAQQVSVLDQVKANNPEVIGCPSVHCFSTPLARGTCKEAATISEGDSWGEVWAEYDTLIFNGEGKNSWDYGTDWKCLGDGGDYDVKLLSAISGFCLCLEATKDTKHIWYFLTKFEKFIRLYGLRPIDILLLVIGIHIQCYNEDIFPRNFGLLLDVVQHRDWKCPKCPEVEEKSKHNLLDGDSPVYFYCLVCRDYFCWWCCTEKQMCEGHERVTFNRKFPTSLGDLLPNLSLFTLLLAGRVSTADRVPAVVQELTHHNSTVVLLALQEAKNVSEKEKEELAKRKDKEKEKEKEELAKQKDQEKEELAKQKDQEKEELAKQKDKEKEELAKQKDQEKEELAKQKDKEKEELAKQKDQEKEELVKQNEEKDKEIVELRRLLAAGQGTQPKSEGEHVLEREEKEQDRAQQENQSQPKKKKNKKNKKSKSTQIERVDEVDEDELPLSSPSVPSSELKTNADARLSVSDPTQQQQEEEYQDRPRQARARARWWGVCQNSVGWLRPTKQ